MVQVTTEYILLGSGVVAAVTVLAATAGRMLRTMYRVTKRTDVFLSDWFGRPALDGAPAVAPFPVRMSNVEARLSRVEAQMHPNGGSTLRDRVDNIASATGAASDPRE